MKQEPSANSGTPITAALKVALKVREVHLEAEEPASAREEAVLAAAQGWMLPLIVLVAVFTISTVYVGVHIGRGWVPADDGTLSQSALRVLQGQLPHHDFAEIYTGGLSVIHAIAFRIFGVNLMALRLCAFIFFLAWIPAVYYIALRFTSAIGAGLVTLLAVAWSYPNYPAAMPSWYNLFFATFGAAALLRYLDVRRARWLFVAGMCGGFSILVKLIGAYYIAGALLFLAFLEQTDNEAGDGPKKCRSYQLFSLGALMLFLGTVIYLVHARLGDGEFYDFVMPALVLVGLVAIGERDAHGASSRERFKRLLGLVTPFIGGTVVPVLAFLVPYVRSGAVRQLFAGVISSAVARSAGLGVLRPAPIDKSIFAVLLLGLLAATIYRKEFQKWLVASAVGLGLALLLIKSPTSSQITSGVWFSVAMLTPMLVLFGAVVLLPTRKLLGAAKLQRQRLMALLSLAAVCSLVQYPFAAPIYLCYGIPLTLLAVVALVTPVNKQPATYVLAALAGFYLLFGVEMLVPDHIYELTHKVGQLEELQLERSGGLQIEYAANFAHLIRLLQEHSPNGLLYAGNDCPEMYFLSGLKNVTRDDSGASTAEVLKALQSDDLKVVVINEAPFFPLAKMDPELRAEVMRRFPNSTQSGIFHVFWRP